MSTSHSGSPGTSTQALEQLLAGRLHDPFTVLAPQRSNRTVRLRAYLPKATSAQLVAYLPKATSEALVAGLPKATNEALVAGLPKATSEALVAGRDAQEIGRAHV